MDHKHHNHHANHQPSETSTSHKEGHAGHGNGHDKHAGHNPKMFRDRFWFSLVLTLPILYFSEQFQAWFHYQALQFPGVAWLNPLLGSILFFYGGLVFLQSARHELMARQPGMMTLISLAITVAYVYSLATSFGAPGMPFYWELATLLVIMLLGHWVEMASVQGASRALDELATLVPHEAHKLVNGSVEDVPVSSLKTGDEVLIRPGEQIPIDGDVFDGSSSVNEAFLTGESKPVSKQEGDEVVAGAVNGEGALSIKVIRTGDETTLSQIQRLVEEAQSSRSRFQNLADRAAGWLFYIAVGAGIVTFLIWITISQDIQTAIARTVTVLVIACPHALGLAIPLVIVNATAMNAKNGILVRNRDAFERARNIKQVAFDKTGTLTEGKFGVRQIYTDELSDDEALALAAALETRSEHALAQAIVAEAQKENLGLQQASEFEVIAGKGIRAKLAGQSYTVGRPEWIKEQGLDLSAELKQGLDEAEARGESVIALMDSSKVLALFALADKVRERAKETIQALKEIGVESIMITGDAEAVAKTVAAELGINRYHARVLPQDKAKLVRDLKQKGQTAFTGDGINDAPALLEADLGIAIGAGTNVAIESADLVLVENDPKDVLVAIKLSQASYRKMNQNLWWATGYNAIAIPLAMGLLAWTGFILSPAVGAIFMSLSTVVVALNAVALRRVRLD
ncbi:MAG: copper-translocating P-type ATPase [Trueperaceae bacterium]|nr:copper-translocating P-type ATPase [Trueperaceae bacterium]